MIDTMRVILNRTIGGGDLAEAVAPRLLRATEHQTAAGTNYITGYIEADGKPLSITANADILTIRNSLTKFCCGNNFEQLRRKDIEFCMQQISDLLHVDVRPAQVTRLDIAANILTKRPPAAYFSRCGYCARYNRGILAGSLYYTQKQKAIVLYDKIQEAKRHKEEIPQLYTGQNVLRIEYRMLTKTAVQKQLQLPNVTAADLYKETNYIRLWNMWKAAYFSIDKITEAYLLNFEVMESVKDLNHAGIISLCEGVGGQDEFFRQLKEAQAAGTLTKDKAFKLRRAVVEAYKSCGNIYTKDEAVQELNNKVLQAARFCI